MDLINMICPPGSGCPLTNGFGLPEILLWVLAFAVIFGVLIKLKMFSKAPTALISIALAFLVLMATPAALITAISTMSTGLLILAIAFIALMGLVSITSAGSLEKVVVMKDGKPVELVKPVEIFQKHGTLVFLAILAIAALIFVSAGGFSWIAVLVGLAVLWMLYEAK